MSENCGKYSQFKSTEQVYIIENEMENIQVPFDVIDNGSNNPMELDH